MPWVSPIRILSFKELLENEKEVVAKRNGKPTGIDENCFYMDENEAIVTGILDLQAKSHLTPLQFVAVLELAKVKASDLISNNDKMY